MICRARTPDEQAKLRSGAYVMVIEHGVETCTPCSDFPPEKAEPWVTPKIGTSRGATLTTKEVRKLGLLP